jgi:hypothetical protein
MRNLVTMQEMNNVKNSVGTFLLYINNVQVVLIEKEQSNNRRAQRNANSGETG